MISATQNQDHFVYSNRNLNHRESADLEDDECSLVARISLGIVAFILGLALIINEIYTWGAIVIALSVIALSNATLIFYLKSHEQENNSHQRQYWDNFYASIRRRNAHLRSAQPGGTRRENTRPLRERYQFNNQYQGEANIQEPTNNERHDLIRSYLIQKKILSKSTNKSKFRKNKKVDELLLPHQTELSLRQSNRKEVTDNPLKLSSWRDNKNHEEINEVTNLGK